ncbi:MAG: DUF1259 domain-containing protein [Tepidisphaeraceae bacterium]|jgi:hypothetical protein
MLRKFTASATLLASILFLASCAQQSTPADNAAIQPGSAPDALTEKDYHDITADLGGTRTFADGVYTITLPRTDLWVQADMGEIPTAAGVASKFYFFQCTCGKDRIVGDFVLADYEVNDVIDALRAGQMDIVGVSPMFEGDKPRMMDVRFQSEGSADTFDKTLKSALQWVGDARTAKQPIATKPAAD